MQIIRLHLGLDLDTESDGARGDGFFPSLVIRAKSPGKPDWEKRGGFWGGVVHRAKARC